MGGARASPGPTASRASEPGLADELRNDPLWRAPLVTLALAYTAGVVLDRYLGPPLTVLLLAAVAGLLAWGAAILGHAPRLAVVYLALTVVALAAGHHHARCRLFPPDDIGGFVDEIPRPVNLRGTLEEEPHVSLQPPDGDLFSAPRAEATLSVLRVTHLRQGDDWHPVSGRARLCVAGRITGLHVGDEVDVVGRLMAPRGPANPGGFDHATHLREQRIRAVLTCRSADEPCVVRLAEGWPRSPRGLLAVFRGTCRQVIEESIPQPREQALAVALLLGDGSAMTSADWDRFVRTGVVAVLIVSGQHLSLLGGLLWFVLRGLGVRARPGSGAVALLLLLYSLMVGGEAPVMRSAVMALALCGAMLLRRRFNAANTFALAWLAVGLAQPAELASVGCQLSFLSVAVLAWMVRRWPAAEPSPLDALTEQCRPLWQRGLRWLERQVAATYGITILLWLAAAPLVVARSHLVPLVGIPLTPPVILLTSAALLTGFLLLLLAPVSPLLAAPFAWLTRWALAACDGLVTWGDRVPPWYVGDVPPWWLWVFALLILGFLLLDALRRRWRWFVLAGAGWLCVGLAAGAAPRQAEELRCTFLSVGHGGCVVLETPDGRTLLYDVGAITGPDVTRRHVAPFLWHRGIRRIDEVFLSHADLDHFNGLVPLLDRFAVGRVTWTATFAAKTSPGVSITREALRRRGIPIQEVRAGDRLAAGEVTIDVLHPPGDYRVGTENVRSLVLEVRHRGRSLLLTGDLEGEGQTELLKRPPRAVDVLMAPHHGSRTAVRPELLRWAQPQVVISCQGPRDITETRRLSGAAGAAFFDTATHGAITVRSHATGMVIEMFRTGERRVVRSGFTE